MTTAIVIAWWVFLGLSLIITLVDVYFLIKLVGTAREIRDLARTTDTAAQGIAKNTDGDVGNALKRTTELTGALKEKSGQFGTLTDLLESILNG